VRLARQFDAHLTGVFSAFTPDPRSFYVMAGAADYYDAHRQSRLERHGALEPESFIADHFPETLVMSAGRPVLFIPYAGVFPTLGANIMLRGTAAASRPRAVHDALPLLQRAENVTVVRLNEHKDEPRDNRIPGADITLMLARHGVKAELAALDGVGNLPPGDVLLSRASDLGADLVVMGAYGHSRWRNSLMGGATRSIAGVHDGARIDVALMIR